jgi:hypothetical protein
VPALILLLVLIPLQERPPARLDFWGAAARNAPRPFPLWPDSAAPPAVRRLLEAPTPEHARQYLDWQAERFRSLRAAVKAVQEAAAPPGELLYFAKDGCGWCERQERELEGLGATRVPPDSPLWEAYGIVATPALARNGRVLRGFATRARIEEELSDGR